LTTPKTAKNVPIHLPSNQSVGVERTKKEKMLMVHSKKKEKEEEERGHEKMSQNTTPMGHR